MSYATLGETGTMQNGFHFEVTPQKKYCSPVAQASNCVCNAGGAGKSSQPGDQCQQWSEFNCPTLSKFCCPKGTIGRPKVYPNGYRFEYTRIGAKLKPWPPCSGKPRPDSNLHSPCFNQNKYEWNGPEIYAQTKSMRPPVF